MLQLVVNVNLLRELNERSLIHAYAKHMVSDSSDLEDNISQASDTVSEFATESNSASSESDKAFKGISSSAAAQFAVVNRVVNEVIGYVKNIISY